MPLASSAFTATGSTAAVMMKDGVAKVSGTFVGTVIIEVDTLGDGVYSPVIDPTTGTSIALTAPGAVKLATGVPTLTRLTCSAFTSGTINAGLRGQ